MCAFSGLLLSRRSLRRQHNLFVDLCLLTTLHLRFSRRLFLFSCPSYLHPVPSLSLFSCLAHVSEKISIPRGNLKRGIREGKRRTTVHFLLRIKREGIGPVSHFLIIFVLVYRAWDQSEQGPVKLLCSLRTHVNKTSSR